LAIDSEQHSTQSLQRRDSSAGELFFEFDPVPGLQRRLRRLGSATAAALRELFHDRTELKLEGQPATTWRFAPAREIAPPATVLASAGTEMLLGVTDDGWCERLGEREWWDYTDESRLLAWMLAHSALLEGLGRILREPLTARALIETSIPPVDTVDNVMLTFTAASATGRTTGGWVMLSPGMVARLASHSGWRHPESAASEWTNLPGKLRLELRVSFRKKVLSASEFGDVLVLGSRAHCWRNLQLTLVGRHGDTRLRTWNASYDGARLTVSPEALSSAMELYMSEHKVSELSTHVGPAAVPVDNIPVSLDFDLGSLSVPLGELAALKPGYVLELPGSLEKLRVTIRANGTRVGYGELVAVGDVLGVQLLALEPDGLR
jgi:type III secretion system YscQ/HrcQ family protein